MPHDAVINLAARLQDSWSLGCSGMNEASWDEARETKSHDVLSVVITMRSLRALEGGAGAAVRAVEINDCAVFQNNDSAWPAFLQIPNSPARETINYSNQLIVPQHRHAY